MTLTDPNEKEQRTANIGFCSTGAGRKINRLQIAAVLHPGLTNNAQLWLLSSTKHFQSAAVVGGRKSNIPADAKPLTVICHFNATPYRHRMIEIDNIIELKTNTKTERLSFATRYLVQINFTFDLTILSDGFSGTSHFCVRRDQLEEMCADLANMNLKLSGTTKLDDNDSDGFIEFQIEPNGRLNVVGQVGGTHEDHFVKFKFQTDQTCINSFVEDFKSLLNHR